MVSGQKDIFDKSVLNPTAMCQTRDSANARATIAMRRKGMIILHLFAINIMLLFL